MADIFLLEDDKNLNRGISLALEKDGHGVTPAYGFFEALEACRAQDYGLYLLDVNLPDGSGLRFCEKLRTAGTVAPILFLTANDTEADMLLGFQAGCDDYIAKPFSVEVLRKKVQAILKRTSPENNNIFRYRELELDRDRCTVRMAGRDVRLSATEYKLLAYLAGRCGKVVSRTELLREIWDIDGEFIDENTLSVNIRRLRQKLGDEKQTYIVTVFGMGYLLGE